MFCIGPILRRSGASKASTTNVQQVEDMDEEPQGLFNRSVVIYKIGVSLEKRVIFYRCLVCQLL